MIIQENLPNNWEYLPIRSIFTESDTRCGDNQYDLLSVTQDRGIIKQSDVDIKKDISNDDKSKYKVVLKDSIAYNKMRMWQGAVGINEIDDGIVSPAYVVINPTKEMNTKFYYYLFKTPYMISQFGKYSYGLVDDMNSLRYDDFKKIYIPIPPIEEQNKIVDLIDKKSTHIESFIQNKTRFIELLKEQKEAIINEAVTKGIDNSVAFKDSKLDFFGEVPKHWSIRRLSTIGKFSKGGGISRDDLKEDGLPAILYGDIYTKYNIKTEKIFHKISDETAEKSIPISTNNLLFTGSGETKEDIGKCIVYVGNETVYVGGDVIIFKQSSESSLYLSYVFNSKGVIAQKMLSAKGEIIVHTYASSLREILFPLPPLEEQLQIAEYIENEFNQIDKLIEKTTKEIELIKEYKISLINEAVSGKIKV
ncbi:restriction endonuclease subunit S [Aliarcobacter butzleri]|uniref:restriction endonuclease subunit S n=1 Tax=Aliarcobacter butzleri TaxID=28197 RepID=UPI0021B50BBD|nr:restriction endonuclease subunit S [Aliarcobacter butzleri]MCT7570854.1 restriction endonuclease subunit S [Aliarcobacter butzleri]